MRKTSKRIKMDKAFNWQEDKDFTYYYPHPKKFKGKLILPEKGKCEVRPDVDIDLSGNITLSTNVLIHEGVHIVTHKHDYKSSKDFKGALALKSSNLFVGEDALIGINALILCVKSIGKGAVIGAGSVLTKDVGPYEVWAGNPAKLIYIRGE